MAELELPQEGTLWTWTSQDFLPKSPPYAGPAQAFEPYFVGYVEFEGLVLAEGRLTRYRGRRPRIGDRMKVVLEPLNVRPDGTTTMMHAFAPVTASGEGDAS